MTLREELVFTMCRADNDVYYRPATKEDGTLYYEYVLVYTDDILMISMHPEEILKHLETFFRIKPESVGPPTKYLGSDVSKFVFPWDT